MKVNRSGLRKTLVTTLALLPGLLGSEPLFSQELQKPISIAVMNDKSSSYSDGSGQGSVVAAQLAIEDVGGTVGGQPVKLLGPDHQNKADIGVLLARQLYDTQGVDAIFDISNSAVSLAVQEIARERGKMLVHVGSATAALFGKACSPTSAMWLNDTYALAHGLSKSIVENGGKTWFFVTADYAFGHAMQAEVTKVVTALGGKVLGSVRHPVETMDFSSYLLQAQASGAQIIALASAGGDTITAIKQAREFNVGQGDQKIAVLTFYLSSVYSLGAAAAQHTQFLVGSYWDQDEGNRTFGKRYAERFNGRMPGHVHTAVYSAVRHYLKAVAATRTNDGLTVMRQMKAMPVDDFQARGARLRADGRLMNDMWLAEVKTPSEVKQGWDLLDIKQQVKAEDIMRPIQDGDCTRLDPQ